MKISALNLEYNNSIKKQSLKIKQSTTTNDFKFSDVASNAIKSNVLANISFSGKKKITQADLFKKETQVRLDSINAHSQLQNVRYVLAPQWLREANELYSMAKEDMKNLNSQDVRPTKSTVNKKITTTGFIKYDSLKRPLYAADLKDGKIQKIYTYDINGDIDTVVEVNPVDGTILSYQKGFSFNKSYDFKLDFFKNEDGSLVPDVYREGHRKDELGFSYYDKVMLFGTEEMTYREYVDKCSYVEDPNGAMEGVSFDFTDMNNFRYTKGYATGGGDKPACSGEFVEIRDSKLVEWDKGKEVHPNGVEIQNPRIILNNDRVVEYDEGYKLDSRNNDNYLQRYTYIKVADGIPDDVLKAVGYLRK